MRKTFEKAVYQTPVDHEAVEREWSERGFTFGIFRDPFGQEWNDFRHTTDEFVVIAEGAMTVTVGDETANCIAGDLVWIPRHTWHSLKTTSQNGSVWLYGYGNED